MYYVICPTCKRKVKAGMINKKLIIFEHSKGFVSPCPMLAHLKEICNGSEKEVSKNFILEEIILGDALPTCDGRQ